MLFPFGVITLRGDDYFNRPVELRLKVERQGHRLLCAGCRPEVWPSGMSRDMGGGRKAYVHCRGYPTEHLVDIFDPAATEAVGTVQQQRDFIADWLESLGWPSEIIARLRRRLE